MARTDTGKSIACGSLIVALVAAAWTGVANAADRTVFDQAGGKPAATAPVGDADFDALQLSGISVIGDSSMFNLVDPRTSKSFWVSLGGTESGVKVVSHDHATDTVVLQRSGRTRAVQLRRASIATAPAAPAAGPATIIPPSAPLTPPTGMPAQVVRTADGAELKNPKTPQEVAQAEVEARMLVSDLLEISMQERARQRALREAQQRGAPAQPAPPSP